MNTEMDNSSNTANTANTPSKFSRKFFMSQNKIDYIRKYTKYFPVS